MSDRTAQARAEAESEGRTVTPEEAVSLLHSRGLTDDEIERVHMAAWRAGYFAAFDDETEGEE